jgi:hypothetical protein
MNTFRIVAMEAAVANQVRTTRSDGYGNTDIHPVFADEPRSFPCRVCLEEARVGDEVLLFSYSPFPRPAPYRNVGPIFVHATMCEPYGDHESIPDLMRRRLLALRGYDVQDRMVACDVVEGNDLETMIDRFFGNPEVSYLHAHNARAGCFLCRIERAARDRSA